jgi:tetratricopeptide (TPR) repeat protein
MPAKVHSGREVETMKAAFACLALYIAVAATPGRCFAENLPPGLIVDAKAMEDLAAEDMRCKKYADAEELYKKLLDLQPDYPGLLQRLGDALWAQDKNAEAVKDYQRYLELNPDAVELRFWMGSMGYATEANTANAGPLRAQPGKGAGSPNFVLSLDGSVGFLTKMEFNEQQAANNAGGSVAFSEYEEGLSAAWEWDWLSAGFGLNYEWHGYKYQNSVSEMYSFSDGYGYYYDDYYSMNADIDTSYGIWTVPLFVEAFATRTKVQPGISLGPSLSVYTADSFEGINAGTWRVDLCVAPMVRFILEDNLELTFDLRVSQPVYISQAGYNPPDMARWTYGMSVGYRM